MTFIKRVLATIVGVFIFCMLCFFFFMLIGLAFGGSSEETVTVKSNSVLDLKLDFQLNDYAGKTTFKELPALDENEKNGLFNIIDAIHYAAADDKIKGISIDNNFIAAGMAQTQALRDALIKFKESGKFITAYADIYTQKDYYLSSVADTVFINPVGGFEFKGLSTERMYYKDFEDKSGLKMEVVKLGKYKSAVEPYLLDKMSPENREQISIYLNSIWNTMKTEIGASRQLSPEQLNTIADNLLARNPKMALASKLVDKIAYYDEYIASLKQHIGVADDKKLNTVTIEDYAEYAAPKLRLKNKSKNRIAVIYAEGEIIYGEGSKGKVGQGVMNKAIKKAREDDKVKAIVLRVNSPGGSALSSELIWREIELTKKVKPVIVSMGNVAASGGYYIACNADKIIAESTTITGSIGVFGVLPNAKGLADKIGINAEQVVTNKNALTYSFLEPLSENQRQYFMDGIHDVYDLFTQRVADGRGMTQDRVKELGEGRVYTGEDALKIGLVDEIGGLDVALQHAAEAANIEDYRTREYPVYEMDIDDLLKGFGLVKSEETILREQFGDEAYHVLKDIKAMSERKGVQLLTVFPTEIK